MRDSNWTSAAKAGLAGLALFAAMVASAEEDAPAPDPARLGEVIHRIKELKQQRHEDVLRHGRRSPQVKEDDRQLAEATGEDHALRGARRKQPRRARKAPPKRVPSDTPPLFPDVV